MASSETTALQRAVGLLARREHSQLELRRKLTEREYTDEEIDVALQRLIETDLQSDERFTHAYIESRYQRGHGPYKITAELAQRGIDENLADQVMRDEPIDWYEHALQVYYKKYTDQSIRDYDVQARRSRFLQQRGFSSEQIQHVMSTVKERG